MIFRMVWLKLSEASQLKTGRLCSGAPKACMSLIHFSLARNITSVVFYILASGLTVRWLTSKGMSFGPWGSPWRATPFSGAVITESQGKWGTPVQWHTTESRTATGLRSRYFMRRSTETDEEVDGEEVDGDLYGIHEVRQEERGSWVADRAGNCITEVKTEDFSTPIWTASLCYLPLREGAESALTSFSHDLVGREADRAHQRCRPRGGPAGGSRTMRGGRGAEAT